jgi:hypothetical protein
MKTTYLLLLTISLAGLMQALAFAPSSLASQQAPADAASGTASDHPHDAAPAPPADQGKSQKDGAASDRQRDASHASDKNHAHSGADTAKSNHSTQLPVARGRSAARNDTNSHPPEAEKVGVGVGNSRSVPNEKAKTAPVVRPSNAARAAPPTTKNIHHRDPNAPVIGGSASSKAGNTGAINGTGMNHRP